MLHFVRQALKQGKSEKSASGSDDKKHKRKGVQPEISNRIDDKLI